jgi:hypothetical protein
MRDLTTEDTEDTEAAVLCPTGQPGAAIPTWSLVVLSQELRAGS